MKIIKLALVIFSLSLFVGCNTPGPMQTGRGPINTPVFKPLYMIH